MNHNPIPTRYRPDIDGLRAFSILAVVIYHAFPALLPGGFVGVDVFFVISGYLITGIILREHQSSGFRIAHFYRRRIQRIFPATLLVLTSCLIAGWWILLPFEYAELGKHTAAGAGFVPNLVYWGEAGYFDTDSKLKPLLHFWSLGVEEQFYLIWPALLLIAARYNAIAACTLLLIALSFAAGLLASEPASAFYLPQNRTWELLAGAAIAVFPGPTSINRRVNNALSLLGAGLLLTAVAVIDHKSDFPRWWALLPVTGASLCILAGGYAIANRLLALRPLVVIGLISFPLYLWHWPLLTFARIMESGLPSAEIRGAAVLLAALLAWLTYRLVERPLRYRKSRLVPALLITGMFLCALAGISIYLAAGLPLRTAELNKTLAPLQWKELGFHLRDDCSERLGLDVPGRCLSDGKPPKTVVLGDSHSGNVFFALEAHLRDREDGVMRLGKGGCPPLLNTRIHDGNAPDICLDTFQATLEWTLANPTVETVYLSSMGPMYLRDHGRYRLTREDSADETSNAEVFEAGLDASVRRILDAGKNVVLVIDWPSLGFSPERCIDTRPLRLTEFTPRPCELPRVRHDRRERTYREILYRVATRHPGVLLWDTPEIFCDVQKCSGELNGTLLYRDPGHLSLPGTRYLGEHVRLIPPPAGVED